MASLDLKTKNKFNRRHNQRYTYEERGTRNKNRFINKVG